MITIITRLPRTRPDRGTYYTSYVNHMWNLYISHIDQCPPYASVIDRSDWDICRQVYAELRSFEQALVRAYYHPDRASRNDTFRACYENAGISEQNAYIILNAITRTVAEKRGLIAPRGPRQQEVPQ